MNRINIMPTASNIHPAPVGEAPTFINSIAPDGFCIKVEIIGAVEQAGQSTAWQFLSDIQQIASLMASGGHTVGDIQKALRHIEDMEAYFTTWRHGNKLIPQHQYDAVVAIKESLQRDNEIADGV
jgi:hypothetical protein